MAIEIRTVGTAKERMNPGKKKGPNSRKHDSYENRPFIAWDGEGYTEHTDLLCGSRIGRECLSHSCKHHYYLFGNSAGLEVSGKSLSTLQCLQLMLRTANDYKSAIHIGFAFDYDTNMILRDLGYLSMRQLKEKTFVHWRGMRIEHIPRKWFQVTGEWMGRKVTCRIQDVFSYYAQSFVKALTKNGIGTDAELAQIQEGKDQRGDFSLSMLDTLVRPYWKLELRLLVELATELRSTLYGAGIRPTGWYGPGNVASYVFKARGVEEYMNRDTDRRILDAAAYAYAGGRFETFRAGYHDGTIYSADINSAYPYALSLMPNLRTGEWEHVTDHVEIQKHLVQNPTRLGLFRVGYRVQGEHVATPYPKFHRFSGAVCWPRKSVGWVFSHEARLMAESENARFVEAWIYHDDGGNPFSWVADMYQQRKEWQDQGNPAEKALKLCLNSMYGKFAQRIGWDETKFLPPRWHQILWAGSITSMARSMLFTASDYVAKQNGLVAVETDGIYSTTPFGTFSTGTGDALGAWKVEQYSGILFLQNGVYWLRDRDGKWQPPKSRGIPQSHMNLSDAMESLRSQTPLRATQSRFQGYGMAVHRNQMDRWRIWTREAKEFSFGGDGKRRHLSANCIPCDSGVGYHEGLHTLTAYQPKSFESEKHSIPWETELIHPLTEAERIDERWLIDVT